MWLPAGRGGASNRRSVADETVAYAVQNLNVELSLSLEGDEPHRRSGRRLGNRFSVTIVVLLGLHVRAHIFWQHQPHLVALRG